MSSIRIATKVAAWTAVGLLGVTGVASAAEQTGAAAHNSSATRTMAAARNKPHRRHSGPASIERRTLHGEFVVAGKGTSTVTLDLQRGTVSAISPTSITVLSRDGFSQTYAITSATKIRVGRTAGAATTQIPDKAHVLIIGVRAGTTLTARSIMVAVPRTAAGAGGSGAPSSNATRQG